MEFLTLHNPGIIIDDVPKDIIDKLMSELPKIDKNKTHNSRLAGNIKEEYTFPKAADILKDYVYALAKRYNEQYNWLRELRLLDNDLPMILSEQNVWVNYQQKGEFNPMHNHSGVYSFVIWLKIPYTIEEEQKLLSTKMSNKPVAGHFEFVYTNIFGQICDNQIPADKNFEGKILFFPAILNHQVYPFYSSDEFRISIAGNLILTTEKFDAV
jgi:hypothetical protein